MSLMTKLTLGLTLTMMRKCFSVSRRTMDENNVSISWIIYRHEFAAKLNSAAVFAAAEDLAVSYSERACNYRT